MHGFTLLLAAGIGLMVAPLAQAQAQDSRRLGQMFDRLDTNHDGVVTRAEFIASRNARFLALDRDHDGFLTQADIPMFAAMISPRAADAPALLARFDTDHDGKVSEAEFVQGSLRLFDLADTNHDGVLTRAEAKAAEAWFKAQSQGARR